MKISFATQSNINLNPLPHAAPGSGYDGTTTLHTALTVAISVIAAICLLFVVIGGLRYIFSNGDPSKMSRAKDTIIYALVGLIITVMAQAIVIFAFKAVSS